MKLHGRAAWGKALTESRIRKLRVALDSYSRRAETMVNAHDLARVLDIRVDAVQSLGRTRIDDLQLPGLVVTYAGGFFTLGRPKLERLK